MTPADTPVPGDARASAGIAGSALDVSVVVVTFNNEAVVGRCLEATQRATVAHTSELIVVDNASTDRTLEIVRERAPGARVVRMEQNLGFAAANNVAFAKARGRYRVLVNSDAFPDPGAIDRLVEFAERHADAGLVGGVLRDRGGRPQPSAGCFPTLARNLAVAMMLHRTPPFSRVPTTVFADRHLYTRARPVDWVSGAFCLATPSAGLLPADGFMYGEDVEWARRARSLGLSVWLEPSARAVHLGSGGVVTADAARARQRHRVSFERRWFDRLGPANALGSRVVMTIHAAVRIALFTALRPVDGERAAGGVEEFAYLLRAAWSRDLRLADPAPPAAGPTAT